MGIQVNQYIHQGNILKDASVIEGIKDDFMHLKDTVTDVITLETFGNIL